MRIAQKNWRLAGSYLEAALKEHKSLTHVEPSYAKAWIRLNMDEWDPSCNIQICLKKDYLILRKQVLHPLPV